MRASSWTSKSTRLVSSAPKNSFSARFESQASLLRRQKNREQWKYDHEDYEVSNGGHFIQERLGINMEDNLNLTRHNVTTTDFTYRNLHTRGLLHFGEGKLDNNKALHIQPNVSTSRDSLTLESTSPEAKRLFERVSDSISSSSNIFYFDRTIGAHSSSELKVRLITDCPNTALYFNNALPLHSKVSSSDFVPDFTVHIGSRLDLPNLEKFNLKSKSFSFMHKEGISFGGVHSLKDLTNDTFKAASQFLLTKFKNANVPLRATSILNKDKLSLVIGNESNLLSKNPTILGAHHQFWTPQGLVPAWTVVSLPFSEKLKLQRGDLVETVGKEKIAHIRTLPPSNIGAHPSSVVFVSDLGSPVSQLSNEEALLLFISGYDGKSFQPFFGSALPSLSQDVVNGFKALIQNNKVEFYAVSPSSLDALTSSSKPKAEKPKNLKEVKDYVSTNFSKLTL